MNLSFNLRDELDKLRKLELAALKADNAVLRQRCKIFPPLEEAIAKVFDSSSLNGMKDKIIMDAVHQTGSKAKAADLLKIGRSTVYKRLRALNGTAKLLSVIVLVLFMWMSALGQAQPFQLTWDYPTNPAAKMSFRLYAHTNSLPNNLTNSLVRLSAGTNQVCTISNIISGTWVFAITALATNGIESLPSPVLPLEVPVKPDNLRTIIAQWNGQVNTTNWQNAGYLLIKFGP